MLPVPDAARAEVNDVDRHANLAVAAHTSKPLISPGGRCTSTSARGSAWSRTGIQRRAPMSARLSSDRRPGLSTLPRMDWTTKAHLSFGPPPGYASSQVTSRMGYQ